MNNYGINGYNNKTDLFQMKELNKERLMLFIFYLFCFLKFLFTFINNLFDNNNNINNSINSLMRQKKWCLMNFIRNNNLFTQFNIIIFGVHH